MAFAAVARSLVYPDCLCLYEATDNHEAAPRQVVFGLADEFCKRLESRGSGQPTKYGKTWTRVHDPLVWRERRQPAW